MVKEIPQINFIKGIAIISVILLHAFGSSRNDSIYAQYHIAQAVPLFLLISCYLGYLSFQHKGMSLKNYFSYNKIIIFFKRIFLPFIISQIVIVLTLIIRDSYSSYTILNCIIWYGGFGPGSYYPYLYLQFWILLPFLFICLNKANKLTGGGIVIVSVIGDILFVKVGFLSNEIYRMSLLRYLFIGYLAFFLLEKKMFIKTLNIMVVLLLACVGMAFVFAHKYLNVDLQPIFYSGGWRGYRFPMYFYTLVVFCVLYKLYDYIPSFVQVIINKIGKYSWAIFCMQMIFFTLIGNRFHFNIYIYTSVSLFIIIAPIYLYKELRNGYCIHSCSGRK